jgi:hypothetical protein
MDVCEAPDDVEPAEDLEIRGKKRRRRLGDITGGGEMNEDMEKGKIEQIVLDVTTPNPPSLAMDSVDLEDFADDFSDDFSDEFADEMEVEEEDDEDGEKRRLLLSRCICFLLLASNLIMSFHMIGTVKEKEEVIETLQHKTGECFQTHLELKGAVGQYLLDNTPTTLVAQKYGWPIGFWCVSNITNFSDLLHNSDGSGWDFVGGYRTPQILNFNEDLSKWDLSSARDM